MYELTRVSLANWYLIDALDIEINGNVAIIGQTGAGKSSILDAIQTALSGNNRNALELNAAAGEQRDRTVRDYALGCVSDVDSGAPRREKSETTIALTFHDREIRSFITVGVFLRAERDQAETTRRFVVDGYDFRIERFLEGGERIMSHAQITDALKEECGSRFKIHPNSSKFVGAYLELMRPSMPPDPRRFLRSFSNALQAREIKDPTDFVRRFVLEPLKLDVEGVRDSIATWRELTDEVMRIEDMLADIAMVDQNYEKGFRIKLQEADLQVAQATYERVAREIEIGGLEAERAAAEAEAESHAGHLRDVQADLDVLNEEIDGVKAALRSSDIGAQRAVVDAETRALEQKRVSLGREIDGLIAPYQELKALRAFTERLPEKAQQGVEAAGKLAETTSGKLPEEWASSRDEVSGFVRKVSQVTSGLEALVDLRSSQQEELVTLRRRQRELQGALAHGARPVSYSRHVVRFLDALWEEGIEGRCLPDLVEITDASWSFALESLLGANREAILVAESDLERAFDLLFRHRNEFDGVRLINTRKLRDRMRDRAPDSIADVATSKIDDVERFLTFTVGGYTRAETEAELDQSRNAIMRNGKTNSGVTKRVFRDRRPILGQAAQQQSKEMAEAELAEIAPRLSDLERRLALLDTAIHRLRAIAASEPDAVIARLDELSETLVSLRGLRQKRESLSAPENSRDEKHLQELEAHRASMSKARDEQAADLRKAEIQAARMADRVEQARLGFDSYLNNEADAERARSAENMKKARAMLSNVVRLPLPERSEISAITQMDPEAAKNQLGELEVILEEGRAAINREGRADDYLRRATNGLMGAARKWMIDDIPSPDETADEDLFAWVRNRHERLRDHELLAYREQLTSARSEMETALTEGLIGKLGEHFALMEQQLTSLNRRLEKFSFVGQTYQFKSSVAARVLPIFEMVKNYGETEKNATDVSSGLAEIEELLNNPDSDIKKFEDYREYFNFELYIEHPDPDDASKIISTPFSSILGKLSGGQRQAPYYVAIAGSMVSAYYPKAGPGDFQGMGLVLFDEAFNKLDVPNTQRLMELFRSLGLQVLVAAPEDKRASLIEATDSVITVSRLPGTSDVFIDVSTIGPAAKAAMRAENPEHRPIPA